MIKLIYTELYKIIHKKGIYIIFIIIFIFCLLNNILFKLDYNDDGLYKESKRNLSQEINDLETKLSTLDSLEYINTKTSLELLQIKKDYEIDSFQYIMTDSYFYDIIYNINYYTYIDKNQDIVTEYQNLYNKYINRYKDNNNMPFIEEELDDINELINNNSQEENLELKKEILTMRINNKIDYSNTYLNRALEEYYNSSIELIKYTNRKLSIEEKFIYNQLISSNNLSKYIIDNKINLNKDNDLRGCLKTIVEDYEIFIIIIIIFISSTIISEEFSKGTIKLLLIRPYKRNKILLSKYLTCIIILLISIIFLILCELWIGGVIFGFDSLKLPIVIYDFTINSLKEYNVFIYMIKRIVYNLPKLLMILTISFTIGGIFLNSILSSITSFSLYIFSDTIINYLSKYGITKYLLFNNWDFLIYINGNISKYFNINIYFSVIIYFIYFLLIFFWLFVIFKKRDIKNI